MYLTNRLKANVLWIVFVIFIIPGSLCAQDDLDKRYDQTLRAQVKQDSLTDLSDDEDKDAREFEGNLKRWLDETFPDKKKTRRTKNQSSQGSSVDTSQGGEYDQYPEGQTEGGEYDPYQEGQTEGFEQGQVPGGEYDQYQEGQMEGGEEYDPYQEGQAEGFEQGQVPGGEYDQYQEGQTEGGEYDPYQQD